MGMMDKVTGPMGDLASKPFRWIDDAPDKRTEALRTAIVGCAASAIGLVVLGASLYMMGVIPGGMSHFAFDLGNAPFFLIGVGLLGGGVGFVLMKALERVPEKKRKQIVTAVKVVGLLAFGAATAALLAHTYSPGFVHATFSSQSILAPFMALAFLGVAGTQIPKILFEPEEKSVTSTMHRRPSRSY